MYSNITIPKEQWSDLDISGLKIQASVTCPDTTEMNNMGGNLIKELNENSYLLYRYSCRTKQENLIYSDTNLNYNIKIYPWQICHG